MTMASTGRKSFGRRFGYASRRPCGARDNRAAAYVLRGLGLYHIRLATPIPSPVVGLTANGPDRPARTESRPAGGATAVRLPAQARIREVAREGVL